MEKEIIKDWNPIKDLENIVNETFPKITKEEFDQHDCHQSPEDGCATCEQFYN